jgi:kynureninase
MTAARAGIELSIEAGIDAIRAKSVALTEYAIELADTAVARLGSAWIRPAPCSPPAM